MGDNVHQIAVGPKTFTSQGPEMIFQTLITETTPANQRYGSQLTFTGVPPADYGAVKNLLKARKRRGEGAVFKTKYDAARQMAKYVREDALRAALQPTIADIVKAKLADARALQHFADAGRDTLGVPGGSEGEADFAWLDTETAPSAAADPPAPADAGWPAGVVEIGYVPTTPDVADDVAFWFTSSRGRVHVALAVKVSSRGELQVRAFESEHRPRSGAFALVGTAHLVPPAAEGEAAVVEGAPVVFSPSEGGAKVVLEEADLLRIGEEAWFVLREQVPAKGVWTVEGGRLPRPES